MVNIASNPHSVIPVLKRETWGNEPEIHSHDADGFLFLPASLGNSVQE